MHVEESDERDSQWERHRNTFRVYFFVGSGKAYSVSNFDIADATFSEAKTWADDEAGDRMYSIALVIRRTWKARTHLADRRRRQRRAIEVPQRTAATAVSWWPHLAGPLVAAQQ